MVGTAASCRFDAFTDPLPHPQGSLAVRRYLTEHGDPSGCTTCRPAAPKPFERVWWHLLEQITRNHQCQDIDELVKLTMAWLDDQGAFKIECSMYQRLRATGYGTFGIR